MNSGSERHYQSAQRSRILNPGPDPRTGITHREAEMINLFKSTLAATALALNFAGPGLVDNARAGADSAGVVTVKSNYSVSETVSRIRKDIAKKGIMFFGAIDRLVNRNVR